MAIRDRPERGDLAGQHRRFIGAGCASRYRAQQRRERERAYEDETGLRACSGCGEETPAVDFPVVHTGPSAGQRYPYCRPCKRKASKGTPKTEDYRRNAALKRGYGITLEQYRELEERQGGRCDICLTDTPVLTTSKTRKLRLCVDHDHDNGAIRGLLCSACNQALGLFKDDPERVERAAVYLRRDPYFIPDKIPQRQLSIKRYVRKKREAAARTASSRSRSRSSTAR